MQLFHGNVRVLCSFPDFPNPLTELDSSNLLPWRPGDLAAQALRRSGESTWRKKKFRLGRFASREFSDSPILPILLGMRGGHPCHCATTPRIKSRRIALCVIDDESGIREIVGINSWRDDQLRDVRGNERKFSSSGQIPFPEEILLNLSYYIIEKVSLENSLSRFN